MVMWSLHVKYRFRSGVEKTKQPARLGASNVSVVRSTCCLRKQAQSHQAVRLLKAPEQDLIREKPKHCDQQRKAWQTTAEQQNQSSTYTSSSVVEEAVNWIHPCTFQQDLSNCRLLWTSITDNCFQPAFQHQSPSQSLNLVINVFSWCRSIKCFSFSFPEPKPQPREQHPGLRWENKHSGVHWQRMGQERPSHVPLSALLCNSPFPWRWMPLGHVWSNRGQSSRLLHPHSHRSPRQKMHASGKKLTYCISQWESNEYTQQQLSC